MNKKVNTPAEGSGYNQLKQKKSIEEILQTAMSFEQVARDFYQQLCNKVSKPLRSLVQELADEEAEHYNLFKNIAEREDIQQYINEKIDTPPGDHQFSDYIHLPDLGENPDDQDVLRYALGREHAAMTQYTALAKDVPPGALADLFQFLANEEMEHKKELEKIYYEVVHSGGV